MTSSIAQRNNIENRLTKAVPYPVGCNLNGTIRVTITSSRGNSGSIKISDEQFKAIELILLGAN